MLHIFGAFAEFAREINREPTVAGVQAARAKGKKLGRPKRVFRRDEAARLREAGQSWRMIARQLNVPASTLVDSCCRFLRLVMVLGCDTLSNQK
jgi:DNA invertase Pin-like site-specific DNA recombinase